RPGRGGATVRTCRLCPPRRLRRLSRQRPVGLLRQAAVKLDDDDFTLFGLPERQALDVAALDEQWRRLQAQVHPDRFAGEGATAQRVAMQWALRVNEAYRRLRDPLRRAAYLCERRG